MAGKIDPEMGFVELEFVGLDKPVRVDAFHALEVFKQVKRVYLRELEDDGREDEADIGVIVKRWVVKFFKGVDGLTPENWSFGIGSQVFDAVMECVDAAKKPEPGSSTPT